LKQNEENKNRSTKFAKASIVQEQKKINISFFCFLFFIKGF